MSNPYSRLPTKSTQSLNSIARQLQELRARVNSAVSMAQSADLAMGSAIGMLQMFPGLVGLWPGGVLRGSDRDGVADVSGNGLHLSRNGNMRIATVGLASVMSFDGTNSYLNHADTTALDITGTETIMPSATLAGATVGAWMSPDVATPAATEYLMSKWTASGNQRSYALRRSTAGQAAFAVSGTGSNDISSGAAAVPASQWTLVIGRFRPSASVQVLINSALASETTSSVPDSIFAGSSGFVLGAIGGGAASFYDGQLALAFVCAAAVPDAMIENFYQRTRGLFEG